MEEFRTDSTLFYIPKQGGNSCYTFFFFFHSYEEFQDFLPYHELSLIYHDVDLKIHAVDCPDICAVSSKNSRYHQTPDFASSFTYITQVRE